MRIEGQVAVVTGGGSGIGAGVARRFAAAGARVAVFDVNVANAEAVAMETGGIAVPVDVADADAGGAAFARVREALGAPRVLVNCAGIGTPTRVLTREGPADLDQYRRVIEVNLVGSFNMLRLAAWEMSTLDPNEDGERGVVINTASVAAYEGQIGQMAYASSKGGIVGMTLPAARELARFGIRVVTIAPGLIETPLLKGLPEEVQKSLGASVPFPPRLGRPDEYARLALHIVDNPMLNGETIRLDGALRMAPK